MIKTASAKAKGRKLQQWLAAFVIAAVNDLEWLQPPLTERDCFSVSMGKSGEDLELSQRAQDLLGVAFECKNLADPKNLARWHSKMAEKHTRPLVTVFNRSCRGATWEPVCIMRLADYNSLRGSNLCEETILKTVRIEVSKTDLLAEFKMLQAYLVGKFYVLVTHTSKPTKQTTPVSVVLFSTGYLRYLLHCQVTQSTAATRNVK